MHHQMKKVFEDTKKRLEDRDTTLHKQVKQHIQKTTKIINRTSKKKK